MSHAHGWRIPESADPASSQAIGRRLKRGSFKGSAYQSTPAQRRAAALTCADHATSPGDLAELLAMLGLTP